MLRLNRKKKIPPLSSDALNSMSKLSSLKFSVLLLLLLKCCEEVNSCVQLLNKWGSVRHAVSFTSYPLNKMSALLVHGVTDIVSAFTGRPAGRGHGCVGGAGVRQQVVVVL